MCISVVTVERGKRLNSSFQASSFTPPVWQLACKSRRTGKPLGRVCVNPGAEVKERSPRMERNITSSDMTLKAVGMAARTEEACVHAS